MEFATDILVYGFERRHLKVTLKSVMPSTVHVNNMQSWIVQFARDLATDTKHSGKWLCAHCGKPARETQFDIMSYLHLESRPHLTIYVTQVCEAKDGPCDRAAKAESDVWRRQAGFPPNPPNSTRNINPMVQPLSRSCALCHRDPSEAPEMKLKRCSRCRLTRYCGVECQKADYNRHRRICKSVVSLEYDKWAVEDRD
ncbi:hypothetical protein R3P38DRAFT_41119 [Favolaschia claudopus]|uniref:MYND-type domain-containing protein n=1 Tax=Favolaschia claudopus TaxID=2862362 RepID=A0AAW0EID6_9AGAR